MYRRGFLVASLVVAVSAPLYGQRFPGGGMLGPGGPGQQGPPPTTAEGVVEFVNPGKIAMTAQGNTKWMVWVTPSTTVHVTGKATPEYIKKNVCVEFTAEVDQLCAIKEKVTRLTVVTLSADRESGLFEQLSVDPNKAQARDASAFGNLQSGGSDMLGDKGSGKKAEKHKPPPPVHLPATVLVRGTVKSCKAGKLLVATRSGAVRGELAADAMIDVDMADYGVAVQGDTITAKGPGTRPNLQAELVKIQLAEPLWRGSEEENHEVRQEASPGQKLGRRCRDLTGGKKAANVKAAGWFRQAASRPGTVPFSLAAPRKSGQSP